MEILQETEKAAQALERAGAADNREKLRHNVYNILHTAYNNPQRHKSNLTETEQKGLKVLKQKIKDNEISVTSHDKGLGFVTLKPEELKQKATAAFQNVTPQIGQKL